MLSFLTSLFLFFLVVEKLRQSFLVKIHSSQKSKSPAPQYPGIQPDQSFQLPVQKSYFPTTSRRRQIPLAAAKMLEIFQPDTLVVCIDDTHQGSMLDDHIEWFPTKNETYTIRRIEYEGDDLFLVYLDEGCVGHFGTTEIGIPLSAFKFLQAPMNLTEIIEAQHFKP